MTESRKSEGFGMVYQRTPRENAFDAGNGRKGIRHAAAVIRDGEFSGASHSQTRNGPAAVRLRRRRRPPMAPVAV
jgi:hypothetical protein